MKINEATSTDLKVIKELEKKTGKRIASGKNFLILLIQ